MLDPIVSLRRIVTLEPDETVRLDLVIGVANDRAGALELAEKYRQQRLADRLIELAWTQSQVSLRHLDCTEADAQAFGRLASALVQANPARRAGSGVLQANHRGQSGLWSYGISGDFPIVLIRITDADRLSLVHRAVQAHAYWRMKGLRVDLVILNEDSSIYRQSLHEQIVGFISAGPEMAMLEKPGGIFVRRLEQLPQEDRTLFQAVARVVLSDDLGTFFEQVQTRVPSDPLPPWLAPSRGLTAEPTAPLPPRELLFFNGLGGFTPDGREYLITLPPDAAATPPPPPASARFSAFSAWIPLRREGAPFDLRDPLRPDANTPAPWTNVIANPSFGTLVTESGGSYTWLENSHEFRLTPWNNDPVTDPSGEAIYLRDDDTGDVWSPTPQPARSRSPYVIRHGFGYTVFELSHRGIVTELCICVAPDAPVKLSSLTLRNTSGRPRRLSVTGYWEWVLGETRGATSLHVQTRLDPTTGALLATNPYNSDFTGCIAFADLDGDRVSCTGDRREFLGRNGTLALPAALKRVRLSGRTGAGLDPCGALQVGVKLRSGEERRITLRLGAGRSLAEVQALIQRFRHPQAHRTTLEAVQAQWRRRLEAVTFQTPDASLNVLANGWLLYQTMSARLWGRTGFYQSGGAFGFRDQLQDALALVHTAPELLREHLLRVAARQFTEGDVQHWWHPPTGRGVRTHISDDYLWLPYAVCRYLRCTQDRAILEESAPFLQSRQVQQEEEVLYDLPHSADQPGTLYDHCVRAVERGLRFGTHGLPLMGGGDWNDGLNQVGARGQGESVWLGLFLLAVLTEFGEVAAQRHDAAFAARCASAADALRENLERHAWDGAWYLRAWFDDGTPLGSHQSQECQIDSLPQSWAVLARLGNPERARRALDSVLQRLVREDGRLIQLFDPPFDHSALMPGYIKGYVPGVRENGGQYTHAAIWVVMAFAELGDHERAWKLLRLINPVLHGSTPAEIATYKVEPYVMPADVYTNGPHLGRGGWTWYTGSASWMYRLIVESLLGIHREGPRLRLAPRLPDDWPGFRMHYRYHSALYLLTFQRSTSAAARQEISIVADGDPLAGPWLPLVDDHREHHVTITLPPSVSA